MYIAPRHGGKNMDPERANPGRAQDDAINFFGDPAYLN